MVEIQILVGCGSFGLAIFTDILRTAVREISGVHGKARFIETFVEGLHLIPIRTVL